MEAQMSVAEIDREQELLAIIGEIGWSNSHMAAELFQVLQSWWQEIGPSNTLQNAVCKKLLIDERVFTIYRHCPALIEMMESLRKGEPIRRVREHWDFSPEARRWWHALLIIRVLLKCDGALSHVRLVRWLSHHAVAGQLRQALEYLHGAGIVETFYVTGTDPLRPMTWYRMLGIDP
jgi:hypothetical protein